MSPVRGSHTSSRTENGCDGDLRMPSFAGAGFEVSATGSSEKNSRERVAPALFAGRLRKRALRVGQRAQFV